MFYYLCNVIVNNLLRKSMWQIHILASNVHAVFLDKNSRKVE